MVYTSYLPPSLNILHQRGRVVDGTGQGQEGHPCAVGLILERARGAEAGTEGGVLGEGFLVVVEVGVAGGLG